MKKTILSLIGIASTALFIGCGSNNQGNNSINPGYPPPSNCNLVNNAFGNSCLNGIGTGTPTTIQYFDYKFYFSFASGQYNPAATGGLVIVNSAAYKQFLKEAMNVCDFSSYSWGGSTCDTWLQGSLQVAFSVDASMKPILEFRAVPGQSWISGNFGLFSGGATLNPLLLSGNTTFNLIANSQGFEIRANGSAWNGGGLNLIQIQVDKGTLGEASFTYKLIYPYGAAPNKVATTFATGTFRRY